MRGRRRTAAALLSALLALASAAAPCGCGDDHGYVEGDRLVVAACGEDGGERTFAPFRLEFTTFGIDPGEGPLYIRAQREGEPLTGGDGLLVTLEDGETVRAWRRDNPDAALSFGLPPDAPPGEPSLAARGALLLAETCPDSYQPLVLEGGQLFVEELGTEFRDRVRVRFEGASVRDMRADTVVGTGFAGELDFEVRTGKPYRWHNP